jgi:FtsP/CotA-like multicopper oxidase with cupredoxin domain
VSLAIASAAACSSPRVACDDPALACAASQRPWSQPLPIPPTYVPGTSAAYPGADYYEIHVTRFEQWLGLVSPETGERLYTPVWGYGQVGHTYDVGVRDADGGAVPQPGMYIAPSFVAERGRPVVVKWIDDRTGSQHLLEDAYDTTLDGTDGAEPHVRMVTHLHGGEDAPPSDGFPLAWIMPGGSIVDTYPNQQEPTTLWYHDHAMGITRLNVMAMGAGLYVIRDSALDAPLGLPSGAYEVPLVIADRMFTADGALSYLNAANTPGTSYHPRATPEFFGNVITVNGMAWPYLAVEPRKYRFRILNASNARMYNLQLIDETRGAPLTRAWQIGTDGGYLAAPVPLAMAPVSDDDAGDRSARLFLAPGERADVVVDFSGLAPGTTVALTNDARAPFPDGDAPDAGTGEILQLQVVASAVPDPSRLPDRLNPLPTRLDASRATVVRHLVLTEVEDPVSGNPVIGLLDNTCFDQPVTERPALGTTEIWEIVDTTGDTHPIHLHLVQFNILDRQRFDNDRYLADWNQRTSGTGGLPAPPPSCSPRADPVGVASGPQQIVPVEPYLVGDPIPPADNEAGWKDTARVKTGTVTRLLVRFAPQDPGATGPFGGFTFDPTVGPYVWHCHILEHEDNGMMRPYQLTR